MALRLKLLLDLNALRLELLLELKALCLKLLLELSVFLCNMITLFLHLVSTDCVKSAYRERDDRYDHGYPLHLRSVLT